MIPRNFCRAFLSGLLMLIIAGCATQAPTPDIARHPGDWKNQRTKLEALHSWKLAGKVGLRTPQESHGANLDWVQQPTRYRMMISGPFGAGRNVLVGTPESVTLTNGDGTFTAATPEQLMDERLGWSLPVSALDYWVRGLPDPRGTGTIDYDASGFPAEMHQAGWQIVYRDWTFANGLWLPSRLKMTYGDLTATLVVTEWHPDQVTS